MGALCPLCGARSTWFGKHNTELWRRGIPDECSLCREEDRMHWKDWEQGIDVTQFGGSHMRENRRTHFAIKGTKVA